MIEDEFGDMAEDDLVCDLNEEYTRDGMFAIMWSSDGLEAVERAPDPAMMSWARLQGKEPPKCPNLNMWQLRARYNSQRHYEIYIITTTPGIDEEDIRTMFEDSPQQAADTIRRIGQKFYSGRASNNHVVIT